MVNSPNYEYTLIEEGQVSLDASINSILRKQEIFNGIVHSAVLTAPPYIQITSDTTIAVTTAPDQYVTTTTGLFGDITAGMVFTISGYANSQNNGRKVVTTAVDNETMQVKEIYDVDGYALVAEAAGGAISVIAPSHGDIYIIGGSATGAWTGYDNYIAQYWNGSWYYYDPMKIWRVFNLQTAAVLTFNGTAWA